MNSKLTEAFDSNISRIIEKIHGRSNDSFEVQFHDFVKFKTVILSSLLIGACLFYLGAADIFSVVKAKSWKVTNGVIVSSKKITHVDRDGSESLRLEVIFEYELNGETIRSKNISQTKWRYDHFSRFSGIYSPEDKVTVFVNPKNIREACLNRDLAKAAFIPTVLGGGLLFFGLFAHYLPGSFLKRVYVFLGGARSRLKEIAPSNEIRLSKLIVIAGIAVVVMFASPALLGLVYGLIVLLDAAPRLLVMITVLASVLIYIAIISYFVSKYLSTIGGSIAEEKLFLKGLFASKEIELKSIFSVMGGTLGDRVLLGDIENNKVYLSDENDNLLCVLPRSIQYCRNWPDFRDQLKEIAARNSRN